MLTFSSPVCGSVEFQAGRGPIFQQVLAQPPITVMNDPDDL
jgi:hypothetical protein